MRCLPMIAIIFLIIVRAPALPAQSLAAGSGTTAGIAPRMVRHVIGLENISSQESGKLTVQHGMMQFDAGKKAAQVPLASIDNIFVGSEATQAGGKVGRGVKTAAIAAPYGSGKVLSLLLRTKVDILTISYRDGG